MKSYPISFTQPFPGIEGRFDKLVHIDAYRLNTAAEFAALKPDMFLKDPKALVVIEWPERVAGALPKPDVSVRFSSESAAEAERYVLMEK
jgi:tRNA threonylcarbamoyladenosine biosynthesis protein TsaE